jgi:anti-sigma regulatory factor (Ser/Thr protein kinase)
VSATRSFRCQPEAVTAARRFVRDVLSDHARETVEAAELMTSELATNCVRHAGTDFELAIHAKGQIRIEVRDTGEGRPRILSPAPREPSGRGLRIVAAMADAWGVVAGSDGKAVWFTLPQPDGCD